MSLRYSIALVVGLALLLGYCQLTYPERYVNSVIWWSSGSAYTYRYKLTLAVKTADGVKSGSTVVELKVQKLSFPDTHIKIRARGEALYIDLGPGRKPLVALITKNKGADLFLPKLSKLYGGESKWEGSRNPGLAQLIKNRGDRELDFADLPDLVTFGNPSDPGSVEAVDPNYLGRTLGDDVFWHECKIGLTDEEVTAGLEMRLSWLPKLHNAMLDGDRYRRGSKSTLANSLSTADFWREGF